MSTRCFARPGTDSLCLVGRFRGIDRYHAHTETQCFAPASADPLSVSFRVIAPLQNGDVDKVKDYVTEILASTRLLRQQQHLSFLQAKPWLHHSAARSTKMRAHRAENSPGEPSYTGMKAQERCIPV